MLQGCPHCADERAHQEKVLREQREQTRLLRDAAEQAESSRRRKELDDEHAQSVRDWSRREEEYARVERIRADEQAREQERREYEQQRQLMEAELAAQNYERDRMTTCPYCGQRYDGNVRKTLHIGYTWTGILGRFSDNGLCPKCYYERVEKGEEKTWKEQDWVEHCLKRLRNDSSLLGLTMLYGEVQKSNHSEIIADIKEKYICAILQSFEEQLNHALRSDNIPEFDGHIYVMNSTKELLYRIDKTAAESLITDELGEKLGTAHANLVSKAQLLQQIQERQRQRHQAIEARQAALNRVQAAEINLKEKRTHEQKVLQQGVPANSLLAALQFGIVGGIGGGCSGCFNGRIMDGAVAFFLMAAVLGFCHSLLYSFTFGIARQARHAVKEATFQLELAKASVPPHNPNDEEGVVRVD